MPYRGPSTACRRALFVLPSLRLGGAERVITTVASELSAPDLEIHLAVLQREGPLLSQLCPQIQVHSLGVRRALHAFPGLRRLICRLKPDVVLASAFRLNVATTLLKPLLPLHTRLVVREVTVLDALLGRGFHRAALTRIGSIAFARAATIVCQSDTMRHELMQTFRLDPQKLVTIFNPVDFESIQRCAAEAASPFEGAGPGPHVIGVGRLEWQKGFDRLIAAFPALVRRYPEARLWLVGDGSQSEALRTLAGRLGIEQNVKFLGTQPNPYRWMRHADLFVLPSRHEGLPNALLEAVACGCAVVAVDHPGGTREFLTRIGQQQRIVDSLDGWQDEWFERPPPEVLQRARELTDVRRVAAQYRDVLMGNHIRAA